jgi:hypothetical protein
MIGKERGDKADPAGKKPAGTGQMDGKELKDCLLETAQKVSTWIIDEVVMKRFQKQAKAFYDDYQEWYSENDQYLKEIELRDKETKEAREKRISKIPPPRPCPLDLLTIPDHHTDPHILHLMGHFFPKKRHEQKFSSEEIMRADYVFLTVLHDKALKDTRHFNPINTDIWPQDEEWAEHLWQRMMEERSGWKPEFLLNELNDALDNVETDLSKLSEEKRHGTNGDKAGETPVTLREFMSNYCEQISKNLLESRVKSLQGLAQREVITLKHTGKWKSGQSKKYLPSYLISNWKTFRDKLTSLPKLKQS